MKCSADFKEFTQASWNFLFFSNHRFLADYLLNFGLIDWKMLILFLYLRELVLDDTIINLSLGNVYLTFHFMFKEVFACNSDFFCVKIYLSHLKFWKTINLRGKKYPLPQRSFIFLLNFFILKLISILFFFYLDPRLKLI